MESSEVGFVFEMEKLLRCLNDGRKRPIDKE